MAFTTDEIKRFEARRKAESMPATQQTTQSTRKKPVQGGIGGFLTSLISEGGAIGGGAKGAALGSALGPIGTILGGAAGAGLGAFAGRLVENKVRDDEFRVGDAAKEGAVSAVFGASPIRAAKGISAAAKAAAGGAEKAIVKEAAEKAITSPGVLSKISSKVTGKTGQMGQKVTEKAASAFMKLTPSQTERIIAAGYDPADLGKMAARYGKDANEVLPQLKNTIKALESGIDKTASNAGRNVRISGDDIINGLKSERKQIAKELGGGARLKQIDLVIADAQKKYGKGITVRQARDILKEANNKFGKAILDDSSDAVVTAAQKLEGNVIRKALKDRFPSIKKALDEEAKNIQLREILTKTQAKDLTGGFKTGKIDLTRPGTMVDTVMNSKPVTRGILNRGAGATGDAAQEVADAFALKPAGIASRVLAGKSMMGDGMQLPEEPIDEMGGMGMDNVEPTPEDIMNTPEMTPDEYDPFAPENLKSSIQQILSQGGKMKDVSEFLSTAKMINELTGSEAEKAKPLNASQRKEKNNAESALRDIQGIRQAISGDSSSAFKAGLPGGSFTQRLTGSADFAASQKNVVDAISRLRSGAAITEDEAKRYMALLPGRFDSAEDANLKLDRLEELLYSFTYPEGGAEVDIQSSLGL